MVTKDPRDAEKTRRFVCSMVLTCIEFALYNVFVPSLIYSKEPILLILLQTVLYFMYSACRTDKKEHWNKEKERRGS
jgi:hypothetical protein